MEKFHSGEHVGDWESRTTSGMPKWLMTLLLVVGSLSVYPNTMTEKGLGIQEHILCGLVELQGGLRGGILTTDTTRYIATSWKFTLPHLSFTCRVMLLLVCLYLF